MGRYEEPPMCTDCSGTGEGQYDGARCSTCNGTGDTIDYEWERWVEIEIAERRADEAGCEW